MHYDDDGPGEHDEHLLDEHDHAGDLVPCPVCGKSIWAHASRCHHCGHEFAGEAWQGIALGQASPLWTVTALIVAGAIVLLLIWGFW